jgi:hypothetical protein
MKNFILIIFIFAVNSFALNSKREGSTVPEVYDAVYAAALAVDDQLDRILVVFDVDNTLLAMNGGFGSDQWYQWKSELVKDDPAKKAALTDWLDIAFQANSMRLTDPQFPGLLKLLTDLTPILSPSKLKQLDQNQKYSVDFIILTSRSPRYRFATKKELLFNGLLPVENTLGFPETPYDNSKLKEVPFFIKDFSLDPKTAPRPISYMDGIFMTSGLPKGPMLKYLLDHYKMTKKYEQFVFIDDHKKHTESVYNTLTAIEKDVITVRFGAEDQNVANFARSEELKRQSDLVQDELAVMVEAMGVAVPLKI